MCACQAIRQVRARPTITEWLCHEERRDGSHRQVSCTQFVRWFDCAAACNVNQHGLYPGVFNRSQLVISYVLLLINCAILSVTVRWTYMLHWKKNREKHDTISRQRFDRPCNHHWIERSRVDQLSPVPGTFHQPISLLGNNGQRPFTSRNIE